MVDRALAVAGVALGAPPVAEICAKLFGTAVEQCKRLTDMDSSIKHDYELSFDLYKRRVELAIGIADECGQMLDEPQRSLLSRVIQQLRSTLEQFLRALAKTSGSVDTFNRLTELQSRLRQWLQDFDGLILAITRKVTLKTTRNPIEALDLVNALQNASHRQPSLVPETPMPKEEDLRSIQYTAIFKHVQYETERSLIEYRQLRAENTSAQTLANVAKVLRSVKPDEMNILPCQGYGENKLMFRVPSGFGEPISLRGLLIRQRGNPRHPLNERVRLLRQLATALLYLHASGLVHHAVRPDCILLLPVTAPNSQQILASSQADQHLTGERGPQRDNNHPSPILADRGNPNRIVQGRSTEADPGPSHQNRPRKDLHLGQAFLMGYHWTRKEDGRSDRLGNQFLEESLYRTNDRQGDGPFPRYYSYLDDVYSFGIVALEIALWESFIEDDKTAESHFKVKPRDELPEFPKSPTAEPTLLHQYLVNKAQTEVPRRMGQKLADLIVNCLNCLSDEKSDIPAEMHVDDGKDAMSYVVTILLGINI